MLEFVANRAKRFEIVHNRILPAVAVKPMVNLKMPRLRTANALETVEPQGRQTKPTPMLALEVFEVLGLGVHWHCSGKLAV